MGLSAYRLMRERRNGRPADVTAPSNTATPAARRQEPIPERAIVWPLKMHPSAYLGLHPAGKYAAVARRILNGS